MTLQNNNSKTVAYIGMFSAFAIIISYLESLVPINIAIPGIKPGFANIVIVLAIYCLNFKAGILINFIRILVIGIMFGNIYSIIISFAGAILSLTIMIITKKTKFFSIVGVSICGGVFHNIGQLIAAYFLTDVFVLGYYLPFLIIGGLITGVMVGILSNIIYERIIKKRGGLV